MDESLEKKKVEEKKQKGAKRNEEEVNQEGGECKRSKKTRSTAGANIKEKKGGKVERREGGKKEKKISRGRWRAKRRKEEGKENEPRE